ncbi:MAG: ATP-binding protein [Bacteriovoracaceae bacterium]|nr:ATP-binding protein [Bacteriovoracaceae bacterium]
MINVLKKIYTSISQTIKIDEKSIFPLLFTLIFVFIIIQYSFNTFDAIFYDLWIKSDALIKKDNSFVVVSMDETTDQLSGEVYPYTYLTHAKLMESIASDTPNSIIYFVDFSSPTNALEQEHLQRFIASIEKFKGDTIVRFVSSLDSFGENFPPDEIRKYGFSLGVMNEDGKDFNRENMVRQAVLNVSGEDTIHLWMANRLREQSNLAKLDSKSVWGSFYHSNADATFVLFRFLTSLQVPSENYLRIPINRVINKALPPGFFKGKNVFIGHQYVSRGDDFVSTPLMRDLKIPKIQVHASIIDALAQEKTIFRIPFWLTQVMTVIISVLLSVLIARVSPLRGLIYILCSACLVIVVTFALFLGLGIWLKMAHIVTGIFLVYYIWVPFRAIAEYQSRYAIQEETKILKQVDRLKHNFISLMSHDLKTPVAKISGIVDLMMVKLDSNFEARKMMRDLQDSTQELNSFISSILDLTKIESQDLKLNIIQKDVNTLIETTVEKLTFQAETKGMKIETELGPLYPVSIDPILILRVISNLVENSIKYSGPNSTVMIKTWDDKEWVYIEIYDNGVGIPEEDLKHIFDKFYRVKNNLSHSIKGSGLGLYLVKYFIELHQGKIQVSSLVGEGTKFLIQLKNS